MEGRYRPSPLPEQDCSSTVIIPGIIQETTSQTENSSSVVTTVEVSAVTEWKRHKRVRFRRDKEMEESRDHVPAVGNIRSSNEGGTSKSGVDASTDVAQTQTETEQHGRRDPGQSRRTARSVKIYPEQSTKGNDCSTTSEAWAEQRHDSHGCESCPATTVSSFSRDDRDVRTHQPTDAPKEVAFTLPAKPASEGKTDVAMDEDFPLRTLSSHSRSLPGLESMSRFSASQCVQDSDSEFDCWCSFLKKNLQWLSLSYFATHYYGVWLQKMPVKVNQLLLFVNCDLK